MGQIERVGKTATSIRTEDGVTSVRYHATDVVRFSRAWVILNSNGWRTVTTKTRMNQTANQFGLGYGVYQRKGEWFVDTPDGRTLEFFDGMMIDRVAA